MAISFIWSDALLRLIMSLIEKKIINVAEFLSYEPELPSYTVPFSWSEDRSVSFLNDIISNFEQHEYRIGNFVCAKDGDRVYLMDGCGRFITLLIILRLLDHDLSINPERAWSEKEKSLILAVSHRLKSRLSFVDRISLCSFILYSCKLVFILTDKKEEAFFFFDSAVSRGLELDKADLLKAYHLCAIRKESNEVKDASIKAWESIDNDKLYSLFETLYNLKRWIRGEVAISFKTDGLDTFKGLENEEYPYLHGILNKPFSLSDPILNGKRFFDMTKHYSSLYPERLNAEINKAYPELEHNFRRLGGFENVGDMYAYKLFLSLLLLYVDRFGFVEFKAALKVCFCFSFAIRFDNPGLSWQTINEYILDPNGFFHTLLYAKTPSEVYLYNLKSAYPDLKNRMKLNEGRLKKLDFETDFDLYLGDEI